MDKNVDLSGLGGLEGVRRPKPEVKTTIVDMPDGKVVISESAVKLDENGGFMSSATMEFDAKC